MSGIFGIFQLDGTPVDPADVQRIMAAMAWWGPDGRSQLIAGPVAFSSFDQVKQQETAVGFKERLPDTPMFFRHGQTGHWQTELTAAQIDVICYHHQETMQAFGYLDAYGRPVINQGTV